MSDRVAAFNHVFQSAAVAVGNGTVMAVGGLAAVGIQVEGITNATVTFYGTIDGATFYAVQVVNLNNGAVVTSTMADGLFLAPTAGIDELRCRIDPYVGGTITVLGKGVINPAGMTIADIDIIAQEDVNVAQMNGVATTMGAGDSGTGVQRVTIATNDINLAAINAVSGATNGAAVVTDADGTKQQYLRGLVKLIVDQITVDIDDVSKGTQTNDVKVTLDSEAVVLGAGTAHIGEVAGASKVVSVTPTITGGAYVANDIVGAIQTITGAARISDKEVILQSIVIKDLAKQDVEMVFWFFDRNPANGTYTDNIPMDVHDTDMGFLVGMVKVEAGDYEDAADSSVAFKGNIGLVMTPNASANLFCVQETNGAPTYTSTSDLTMLYGFLQD